MSLFPLRLKPGGTITVHLRWQSNSPIFVLRKDWLIDPNGNKTLCYERLLPYIPPMRKTDRDYDLIEKTGQIYGGAPILMAARYLQNDIKNTGHFLEMLVGLADDTHHYYTLKIPEDAPLGRYHFELEDIADGKVWRSQTSDTDYFYVEKLLLPEVINNKENSMALIENRSPEPVLGELVIFNTETGESRAPELLRFEAKSVTKVPFFGAAMLSYRDQDEFIRLSNPGEKYCLGHPKFQMLLKKSSTFIFDKDSSSKAYELSGSSRRIWRLSNGFIPKSIIKNEENASVYDEMVRENIILEID